MDPEISPHESFLFFRLMKNMVILLSGIESAALYSEAQLLPPLRVRDRFFLHYKKQLIVQEKKKVSHSSKRENRFGAVSGRKLQCLMCWNVFEVATKPKSNLVIFFLFHQYTKPLLIAHLQSLLELVYLYLYSWLFLSVKSYVVRTTSLSRCCVKWKFLLELQPCLSTKTKIFDQSTGHMHKSRMSCIGLG